jgi:hypothetical protein
MKMKTTEGIQLADPPTGRISARYNRDYYWQIHLPAELVIDTTGTTVGRSTYRQN